MCVCVCVCGEQENVHINAGRKDFSFKFVNTDLFRP